MGERLIAEQHARIEKARQRGWDLELMESIVVQLEAAQILYVAILHEILDDLEKARAQKQLDASVNRAADLPP